MKGKRRTTGTTNNGGTAFLSYTYGANGNLLTTDNSGTAGAQDVTLTSTYDNVNKRNKNKGTKGTKHFYRQRTKGQKGTEQGDEQNKGTQHFCLGGCRIEMALFQWLTLGFTIGFGGMGNGSVGSN